MNHKTYITVSTGVFTIVAFLQLARVLFGWDAVMGGWEVPMWLSWGAAIGAGFLAYSGYKQQR